MDQARSQDEPAASVWVTLNTTAAPIASWRDGRDAPHRSPQVKDTEVGVVIPGAKTIAAVKRKIAKWNLLDMSGWLAFRHSVVEPALAEIDAADDLTLHPVAVVDSKGQVADDDWGIVEVRCECPLDRDACEATFFDPDNRHGSAPLRIETARYGPGRAPAAAAFRIGEAPAISLFRPDVAERIKAAVGRKLGCHEPLAGMLGYARVAGSSRCELTSDAEAAERGGKAFWQLISGGSGDDLRAAVLGSPHFAYWMARIIDKQPTDETRGTVLEHPHYAAEYAQLVDGEPRDDTRLAAAADSASALHYAVHVDRALTPPVVRTLQDAGWGDADLDTLGLPRRG